MKKTPATSYAEHVPEDDGGMFLLRELQVSYVGPRVPTIRIASSREVAALLRDLIPDGPAERFITIFLDAKNRPIGHVRMDGGLSAVAVAPSDLLRPAILASASGMVLGHNHPSGDPTPSSDDVAITDRVKRAGTLMGVRVLDHVIIGSDGYFSFLDSGLLT